MSYKEALIKLIEAIENSELGWNGIDAFPEDFYELLNKENVE